MCSLQGLEKNSTQLPPNLIILVTKSDFSTPPTVDV